MRGLRQQLACEDRSALGVLDLDHPEVRIARDLARDVGVGRGLVDRRVAGAAEPAELARGAAGLRQHGEAAVAPVELDQDGAGFIVAAARDRDRDRLPGAEPHRRLHEDARLEANFTHRSGAARRQRLPYARSLARLRASRMTRSTLAASSMRSNAGAM